jgi:hypothetical protein
MRSDKIYCSRKLFQSHAKLILKNGTFLLIFLGSKEQLHIGSKAYENFEYTGCPRKKGHLWDF